MKNIRKLIPAGVLPSRKKLIEISNSIDIREPEDKDVEKVKVVRKATEDSWKKTIKLVNSAISFKSKSKIRLTIEKIVEELKEKGFNNARMVSGSKSFYHEKNPQNVVFFNANLIDKKMGKIFYGDLDLTKDATTLIGIAKKLKTTFYVLSEMDGRFENEKKSVKELIKVAKWNTEMFVPIYDKDFKIVDKRQLEIDCREATK